MILAKTIKGWTLGPEIEARNATHQIKKMTRAQLKALRDRLYLTDDIPDSALEGDPPYVRPPEDSDAMEYLRARGRVLAGPVPSRVIRPARSVLPDDKVFEEFASGSGKQSVSTTMVFARLLRNLVRDPAIGPLVDRAGPGTDSAVVSNRYEAEAGTALKAGHRIPLDVRSRTEFRSAVNASLQ